MIRNNSWMLAAILFCGLIVSSCVERDNPVDDDQTPDGDERTNIVEPSVFASYMDMSTYAGDDFYQYAVGQWLADNPLKPGEDKNGPLAQQSAVKEAFIESLPTIADGDEVLARLKADFSIDHAAADKQMLQQKVDAIDGITTVAGMYKQMAALINEGYTVPYALTCYPKERQVMPYLTLATKSYYYYIDFDKLSHYMPEAEARKTIEVIDAWKKVLVAGKLMSSRDGGQQLRREERAMNRPRPSGTRADIDLPVGQIIVALGYAEHFSDIGADGWNEVNSFLAGLSLEELKCFCKYFVVSRDIWFTADGTTKFGNSLSFLAVPTFSPLASRISALYNNAVPAANRAAAVEMAERFRQTFKDRINRLTWMSEATKTAACEKVDAMLFSIGWPADDSKRQEWMVKLPGANPDGPTSFYWDACDLYRQSVQIVRSKVGSRDERDLFYSDETEVPSYLDNAFYSKINNNLIITSSNILAPIYNPEWGDAINYAVLGATTIGHEMTHGFDTRGHFFDKYGRKIDWMTAGETKAFDALTDKLGDHFSNLSYFGIHNCDGYATLTENVADLGGLCIGLETLTRQLDKQGIAGAERDRQCREFFRAFAYAWMGNLSEAEIIRYNTNDHAIPPLRVDGNVAQLDEFYRLFGITGGKMYLAPRQRIHIW